MTTRLSRLAVFFLASAAASAVAQTKDLGPAAQYYKQTPPKNRFKILQSPTKGKGDIKYSLPPGGHQQFEKDEYAILEPDVTIEYQDVKVHADKITVNFKTRDVVAQGHVIVDQGPNRISADQVYYNLDTKLGTFFHATGAMDPSLYFTGDKIEKTAEESYHLENGVFTSCDLDQPAWSFHVASADITLDDYAHLHRFSFRARKLPIFWAPRLTWPTKKDRSRGFLIPRLLISPDPNGFGSRLEMGYFIPIGDTADTTLYADLNTKGYNGLGVDVRYLPTPDIKLGELNLYTVHDAASGAQQWRYKYRHSQENLPGGFRGVVDVEDFSDLGFFRNYDRDPRLHTLSQVYSSAYLTKNRSNYSLNILADRRDIVLGTGNERQRFEQLPTLQFRTYPSRILSTPLYFSLESSLSHLAMSNLTNIVDASYARADVFPTLSAQIRTPSWLSIRPQVSFRETYYTQALDPAGTRNAQGQQEVADESLNRSYAQAQVEVVGPSFSRVFNIQGGGFSKFKHVIEPRFRYLYTTDVKDQNRVIPFDTVDTPFLPIVRDSVEYSLTQRIIGKEAGPNGNSREVLSFALRQTVSLSNAFTTQTGGNLPGSSLPPGDGSKFTPLTASLHVNPYQSITFDANASFGNVSHQIDQSSVSANLVGSGDRADKYLSFTYFATYNQPSSTFDSSSSQIRLNTGSSILHDRLRGDIQLNFDAKKGTFLEQRYLLGGNGSCYGLALEYRRYLVYDPLPKPAHSYGIAVTLKNVGTIGTH
jgi:LPS-assembly protein